MSEAEIMYFFVHARDSFGHGCLSEPFRVLSGLASEQELAELATEPTTSPLFNTVLSLTLKHLEDCMPLVLEEPRTLELAATWFPQLALAFQNMPRVLMRVSPRCPLQPPAERALRRLAAGEQLLYDAVLARIQTMLAASKGLDSGGSVVPGAR